MYNLISIFSVLAVLCKAKAGGQQALMEKGPAQCGAECGLNFSLYHQIALNRNTKLLSTSSYSCLFISQDLAFDYQQSSIARPLSSNLLDIHHLDKQSKQSIDLMTGISSHVPHSMGES